MAGIAPLHPPYNSYSVVNAVTAVGMFSDDADRAVPSVTASEAQIVAGKHPKILAFIAQCDDTQQLKLLIKNARDRGVPVVADAAFRKLIAIVPSERPGTVEHDFWRTIYAFEHILTDERGKTTRLSRTRQKVRLGVVQTLQDWALDEKQTDGFKMLLDRGLPELTGEAVVLRHAGSFEARVVAAASRKLSRAGVDLNILSTREQ